MSKSPDFVSVQPENRSTLEEALEYAWHRLIENTECPYPLLKQPLHTPNAFVALLAAERGVLDWQPDDSLAQQRQTAHRAFEIHRKAGTRHGLKVALDVLDCDLEITPWYQMENSPGPYHIDVIAWRRNEAVNKKTADRVRARIDNTKSERDTVSLTLAFGLDSGFTVAGAAHRALTHSDDSATGNMPPVAQPSGSLCLGGGQYQVAVSDDNVPGALPPSTVCVGTLFFYGAIHAWVVSDLTPGATA
ncbi:phage tail protein I [Photobacterium sp. TLY01]|uniref:phage tail protein I n=1 Tax=Photobacterium sp. TLY01 TaxID=2907534 RepID=UPI001F2A28D4|nr:phage tail protein I [Photobacterium sp. TLY01]UIP28892.1 phage tail protein I [Photobacterium sp. TLY01]